MNAKIFLSLGLLGCSIGPARAGDPAPGGFSIEWFTLDGGGGTTGNKAGGFTVQGTIGQTDPGTACAGPFNLQGGFWGLYGVIQTPGAPFLTISRLANGDLRVAWPLPAAGWVLDESTALGQAPDPWSLVPEATYQSDATHRFVIIPQPTGNRFYGLRKP